MRWEKFLRKRFTLENGSAERKKKVASLLTRLLEEAKVLADVPSVINSEKWCTNVQLVLELDVLYQRNAGYSEEVTAHMWRYYKATKDGTEASQKALEAAVGAAVRISSTHVMATPKAPEGEKPTTPGESATARPPAARGKKPHPKLLGELAPQQRFKSGGVVPTGLGPGRVGAMPGAGGETGGAPTTGSPCGAETAGSGAPRRLCEASGHQGIASVFLCVCFESSIKYRN
eukprot:PhM_4_TR3441/c1_g1_i3/m.21951